MAKLFLTAAILISACCMVLVKGLDKDEVIAEFVANMEACKEEVAANDSDIEDIFNVLPASTEEGKCLRACLLKKYEVMDENGKMDKDLVLGQLEQLEEVSEEKMQITTEILEKCSAIEVSDDHCEAAAQYGQCFKEEAMARDIFEELKMKM